MAEAIARHQLAAAAVSRPALAEVVVDSAGTGGWHIGSPADKRARQALREAGYDGDQHRARQFESDWFERLDLVIALDAGHLRTLRAWAPTERHDQVRLLRSFDPQLSVAPTHQLDVRDPYYDDLAAFREVRSQIEAACAGLVAELAGTEPAHWSGRLSAATN
jgi:protein-tyrosine phosphatase